MLCLSWIRNTLYNSGYLIDVLNIQDFSRISAGKHHSVVLKNDGTLHAWGDDEHKQVTDTPKDSGFISISVGMSHSVALKDDETLHSWGDNYRKQVSDTPKD